MVIVMACKQVCSAYVYIFEKYAKRQMYMCLLDYSGLTKVKSVV